MNKEVVRIFSETGRLRRVVVHTPGPEIENMTPQSAERALYSDILNLQVARAEYEPFKKVLEHFAEVLEVRDLLTGILENEEIRALLVRNICEREGHPASADVLMSAPVPELVAQLIEGIPLKKDTLAAYLSRERYALRPLHNLFFTRDIGVGIFGQFFSSRMATKVRSREARLMEFIFTHHPAFQEESLVHGGLKGHPEARFEGGDIQIFNDRIILIGIGSRTSAEGVDLIVRELIRTRQEPLNIIVQELPETPESFIHLDMVFTVLDHRECMVYEPVVLHPSRYQTVLIETAGGSVKKIRHIANIPEGLKMLGEEVQLLYCGGREDLWIQQREQWHSGANFFALEPGKILGYARNVHTVEELNRHGYEVIPAGQLIAGKVNPVDYRKCVITLSGSELARGGGGARCMTLPLVRD